MEYNKTLKRYYYNLQDAESIIKEIKLNNELIYTGGKKNKYLDLTMTFDIESSNIYKRENELIKKVALMYIWQFCIYNDKKQEYYCVVGRTWEEFVQLTNLLKNYFNDGTIVIFIHNLSYEFSFLRHYFEWEEVFAVKSNSPLYAKTTNGIEFRCSYLLSGCSLEHLETKQFHKAKGDLDYKKIRTAETLLTDREMSYCLLDVLVLAEYINGKRQQDGSIGKMQRTKTGYARKGILEHCVGTEFFSDEKDRYIDIIKDLQFHSYKEYLIQNFAFQGGHTTACPWYTNKEKTIKDVTCYDFTSSYPAVMCMEDRFPTSFFRYQEEMEEEEYKWYLKNGYAIVCCAHYKGVENKCEFDDWIPSSKIYTGLSSKEWKQEVKNGNIVINNGKVHKFNGTFEIYITNIDYEIYNDFYNYEDVYFSQCYIYKTGYLPKSVIEYVLELYSDKTTLKGIKGRELEYQLKKELLNSLYGMAVTDVCKDKTLINFQTGEWKTEELTDDEGLEHITEYNKKLLKGRIATPYIWGIYISAFARYNLHLGIIHSGNKCLWVYADTDSIYVRREEEIKPFIEKYNREVKRKMEKMCKHYGFPKNIWRPKTVKGIEKPLGYWDFDGHYIAFKTLGAKRYMKMDDDFNLTITVAGLGKKQGRDYLVKKYGKYGAFGAFKEYLEIPKGETGKLMHTIITEEVEGDVEDYIGNKYHYKTYGGTHLDDASFNLSLDSQYIKFLLGIMEGEML